MNLPDALLARARRVMARRHVTLRQLVEDGLRRALDEAERPGPFAVRDAAFRGARGFAPGAGPDDVREVLREMNEPRPGR